MRTNTRQRFLLIALLSSGLSLVDDWQSSGWLSDLLSRRLLRAAGTDCAPSGRGPNAAIRDGICPVRRWLVINQGQYHTEASLIPRPRCFYGEAPGELSKLKNQATPCRTLTDKKSPTLP